LPTALGHPGAGAIHVFNSSDAMPRNIEIKARIDSVEALLPRACAVAGGAPQRIEQDDSFFAVPHGRLKLRQFADGSAELIHYQRADGERARASDYVRVPVVEPGPLREALERSCGGLGRVRKVRWLLLAGATRIHLDRVEGLGDFIELEVVLQDGQGDADGVAIAEALMHALGLAEAPRIAGAYRDLLNATGSASAAGTAVARKS
jgi:adenylate cyclase class IV